MFVTRHKAMRSQTTHQFILGAGHYDHGTAPIPVGNSRLIGTGAHPPTEPKNGSMHVLAVPGGGKVMEFTWVTKERAWARAGGHRMAFSANYLSHVGWTYVRPVT